MGFILTCKVSIVSCNDTLEANEYGGTQMKDFQGKTVVVTGGASGIDRGLADKFASEY